MLRRNGKPETIAKARVAADSLVRKLKSGFKLTTLTDPILGLMAKMNDLGLNSANATSTGGILASSGIPPARISATGAHSGGSEELEEYFQASA